MHSVNNKRFSVPNHLFCRVSVLGTGVALERIVICLEATKGWITMDLWILISSSLTYVQLRRRSHRQILSVFGFCL